MSVLSEMSRPIHWRCMSNQQCSTHRYFSNNQQRNFQGSLPIRIGFSTVNVHPPHSDRSESGFNFHNMNTIDVDLNV